MVEPPPHRSWRGERIVATGLDEGTEELPYDPRFIPISAAIGRVAAQWSAVEFALNEIVWMLADVERSQGACITAQLIGPGPRFRAILALLSERHADSNFTRSVNQLSNHFEGLASRRNRVVHDPWSLLDDGQFARVHVTADRQLKYDLVRMSIQEVDDLYRELVNALQKVFELGDRIREELPNFKPSRFELSAGIGTTRNALDPA